MQVIGNWTKAGLWPKFGISIGTGVIAGWDLPYIVGSNISPRVVVKDRYRTSVGHDSVKLIYLPLIKYFVPDKKAKNKVRDPRVNSQSRKVGQGF